MGSPPAPGVTPDQVKQVRKQLGLTQAQLAQLLGVHALTVSKWERGVGSPTPHHAALLDSFAAATKKEPGIGETVAALLVGAGLGFALYQILKAAFEGGGPKPPKP